MQLREGSHGSDTALMRFHCAYGAADTGSDASQECHRIHREGAHCCGYKAADQSASSSDNIIAYL